MWYPSTTFACTASYLRPLLALVLFVAILYFAKPVIVALVLSVLLTFVLAPVVSTIQRRGLGRGPAVFLTAPLTFVTKSQGGMVTA